MRCEYNESINTFPMLVWLPYYVSHSVSPRTVTIDQWFPNLVGGAAVLPPPHIQAHINTYTHTLIKQYKIKLEQIQLKTSCKDMELYHTVAPKKLKAIKWNQCETHCVPITSPERLMHLRPTSKTQRVMGWHASASRRQPRIRSSPAKPYGVAHYLRLGAMWTVIGRLSPSC